MITRRLLARSAVLVSVAVLMVVSAMPTSPTHGLDSQKGTPAEEHRIIEKVVAISAGDHNIPATLAVPRGGGPKASHPGVLLLHGFASSRDEVGDMYKRLARALGVRGYASLRIDFAGSGDSTQPFVENTFDGMVSDSRMALDYFIDLPAIQDDRVGIVGFSLGSRIAAVVAGTDSRVKAFGSWSGAVANGRENFEFFFETYLETAQREGSVEVDLGFRVVELSLAWFESMEDSRAQDQVAGYVGPLLAIAGTEDVVVDPVYSRRLILHAGSLDATLRILEGADHIFKVLTEDQTLAEMVLTLTADWFRQKL